MFDLNFEPDFHDSYQTLIYIFGVLCFHLASEYNHRLKIRGAWKQDGRTVCFVIGYNELSSNISHIPHISRSLYSFFSIHVYTHIRHTHVVRALIHLAIESVHSHSYPMRARVHSYMLKQTRETNAKESLFYMFPFIFVGLRLHG